MSLFAELQRRNVVRMAIFYIVVSWLVLQVADVLFEQLGVPPWAFRLVLGLLTLGFPFALVFSWVFEMTPEGLKREHEVRRGESITRQTGNRMNITIVVLLVLAIIGLIADRWIPETAAPPVTDLISAESSAEHSPPSAATDQTAGTIEDDPSIAVLPFVNMSGDPENEYFSDGLSEELLNALVRLGGLKVTGRTSSFAFKGRNEDLREIGRLLNVTNVLEGSVRKAGNRVRISAQLVKTSDGFHLWSETFDRELGDIFAIQQEIAKQVSGALNVALLGREEAVDKVIPSSSQNARAYEEYLRGMYIFQRNPDDLDTLNKSRRYFEQSLAIDEKYVDGYWGMFKVWNRMNWNSFTPFDESAERMRFFASELERLAPGSEQALNSAARSAMLHFDFEGAVAHLEAALSRYPGSSSTQSLYGGILQLLTKFDQAQKAQARALQLDPLSLQALRRQGSLLHWMGDCDGVQQTLERALELDPNVGRIRYALAINFLVLLSLI